MAPKKSRPAAQVQHYPFLGYAKWHAVIACLFLISPIAVMIPISFTSGEMFVYPLPGLSNRWYDEFFTNPLWRNALWNSVIIGTATTLIAVPLGTLVALGLNRLTGKWAAVVMGIILSPIVLPGVVFAVSAFYFYSRQGIAGSYAGLIIGHTALALPFVVIIVSATLKGFDPNLARASLSLGATPWMTFRMVVLPMVAPGVASGAVFAFVTSFDELIMTMFVASPQQRTLPLQIWSGVQESSSPVIIAAAMILMLASIALMMAVEFLRRRRTATMN